jgi:hypothetical protein
VRAFGCSSLPKLFAAFNATDTLRVVPAVRSVGGNCVDEKGCDAEKTIACAMKLCGATLAGATNGRAVDFVACADETDWSTAPKLAAACAAKAGVSADDVMTCFASSEAADLLAEAANRAGQESELPNFKGSFLGRFPLVLADFWTSDHLSERSRSVNVFFVTRARETPTLKRR